MDVKQIDLLERIKDMMEEHSHFKELTRRLDDLDKMPLGNLLLEMEKHFSKAATVKSSLSYFEEFVGVGKSSCILVTVVSSLWLLKPLNSALALMNQATPHTDYIVARAYTFREGSELVNYFRSLDMICGLVVESILPNGQAPELIKKCRDLPICVAIHNPSPENIISFIADGATSFVDVSTKGERLKNQFIMSINTMFGVNDS